MEKLRKTRQALALTLSLVAFMVFTTVPAEASTSINNPLSGKTGSLGGIINSIVSWGLAAIAAIAGAFFLFHLYKAIIGFMAGSHHAQRREEAKTHLWYVIIAGVLLGGAGVFAGALFNFGHNL
ncbi:hypothetical protein [Alicyclobacillus sp. SP_1]|uniref:hypothetical protein n=1 Tax=Alicyclobacillus sp. SP_1 TaxID=2942475 RepID=UPI0021576246|nr:hypothetical protein [Alicyclobacillus sp. SP_1]